MIVPFLGRVNPGEGNGVACCETTKGGRVGGGGKGLRGRRTASRSIRIVAERASEVRTWRSLLGWR